MSRLISTTMLALLVLIPAARAEEPWRFSITPYLWLPAVDANLSVAGVPFGVSNETNSVDLLSDLDFGMLACAEVRKGKVGLFLDFQYIKFGIDGSTGPFGQTGYDSTLTIAYGAAALEYRVIDQPTFSLDALAGARALYAKTSLDVGPTPGGLEFEGDQSKTVVDGIVGLKTQAHFGQWVVNLYGDIGTGGSDLSWQALGTIGYRFNEHLAVHAGYRYFSIDIDKGNFNFETDLHGPLVGVTISF